MHEGSRDRGFVQAREQERSTTGGAMFGPTTNPHDGGDGATRGADVDTQQPSTQQPGSQQPDAPQPDAQQSVAQHRSPTAPERPS